MSELRAVIAELYRQVQAPAWAAPNLDGLADVLRDLSWLPSGPVTLQVSARAGTDLAQLRTLLRDVEAQTADGPRPIRIVVA